MKLLVILIAPLFLASCSKSLPPIQTVQNFNLNRYEGLKSNGEPTRITGSAKLVGDGKLEVRFHPFPANLFPSDYWILWIDEDYERAIVGTPDRKYLWILSKDPADILSDFTEPLQMIKAQGFEIEKLLENPKRLAPNSRPTLLVER